MTFASTLRNAIAVRGMSAADLRRATGINETTLHHWLTGTRMPTLARADRLADVLMDERVATSAAKALERRCARCRRQFYADARNRNHTRYCGKACRMAVHRARARRTEPAARKIRTASMERAIADYCRACEPSGVCRTAACPLRPFSPLPLATR